MFCFVHDRKKVPVVPESLLKRRKAFAAMKAARVKKLLADKKVCKHRVCVCSFCSIFFFYSCDVSGELVRVLINVIPACSGPQSDQETDLQEG